MSESGDTDDVLHRFITDDHAERLLAGHADADDDELAPIARLFAVLRDAGQATELEGTDEMVARMAAAVRDGGVESAPARRKPVLAKLITAKVAVLATVALFSAGAAAAATGHLPDPLQRTVSHTFSHVGVDLPSPADGPDTSTTDQGPTTRITPASDSNSPTSAAHAAVGPDATGQAKTGLCTAYVANGGHGNSRNATAFKNLTDAAAAAGETVEEFCTPTTTTSTSTSTSTTETTSTTPTSNDSAKPAGPGNSGSTPGATAPGKTSNPGNSGSTPAATAPGKTSNPGNSGSRPAATAPGRTTPTSAHGRP